MKTKHWIQKRLRLLGYEVTAYSHLRSHELRRSRLLAAEAVDLVLDGGANRGQYAEVLRRLGYKGRIISVEPDPEVFGHLRQASSSDLLWDCLNVALGPLSGAATLQVAEIPEVSSLLPATGVSHTEGWRSTRALSVPVRTIDEVMPGAGRFFIKLDLQGFELQSLRGAARSLAMTRALEVELSTVPLYRDSALLPEVIEHLRQRGFSLFSAEPALVDHESGRVLQFDGLFVNDR